MAFKVPNVKSTKYFLLPVENQTVGSCQCNKVESDSRKETEASALSPGSFQDQFRQLVCIFVALHSLGLGYLIV